MKLKVRNFNWLAGRPVVIINNETAVKLNIHVDERVSLGHSKSKKIYAVVDIFENLVKTGEIGLSHEISSVIKIKNNSLIEVGHSEMFLAGRLIKKKISGQNLSEDEIKKLVSEIVHNNLTEVEIAYFVAAEKLKGMSMKEITFLIKAMTESGNHLEFSKNKIVADKHCIGGIAGNRTTPILVPICAIAGLTLPKTSSRAITSASGTADVVETLAKVEFPKKELERIVNKTNACLAWGGSLGLAPSDDKIIQVERLLNLDVEPQLLASILSKKIAAGSKFVLIDIPYGKSAKTPTKAKAKLLGEKFKELSKHFDLKLDYILTDGKQPIGNGFGPILEMIDILAVLQNKPNAPEDLAEKSILLASRLMELCGIKNAKEKARENLRSGKAYEKFKEIINEQNGKNDFDLRVKKLKLAKFTKLILAQKSGKIIEIDNKKINSVCRILGTPETQSAGLYLYKHLGSVKKGEKLMTLYSESKEKIDDAMKFIKEFKPITIK
ncbi:MAG: thymidine phosphorylase [Nanoarchaeota archaeon]|nr:thymidine phosphorylase [Nanoarchaeota archaeon]